jgi:hypothetical protein
MKKSFILMCFFCTFIRVSLNAQVAQSADCSSIEVASLPSFPQDIFGQNVGFKRGRDPNNNFQCAYIVTTYGAPANNNWKPRYFLEKKTGNAWFTDAGPQVVSSRFSNLQFGATYRIAVEFPQYKLEQCNSGFNGRTPCFLTGSGVFIGFWGEWSGTLMRTNEITMGATQQSDLAFSYLNGNGSILNSRWFDPGENVSINTSASKNYDKYSVAIQEFYPDGVTPGRWRALGNGGYGGWIQGQMPPTIDLSNNLWDIGTGWVFNPLFTYRLQIVVSKDNCPSWTQSLDNFFICNAGFGCRAGGENKADAKIVISPNPVSNKFRIDGVIFNEIKECRVSISDMSGKEIQRFTDMSSNEFTINTLANGIYIVSVMTDNQRLFSSKLVINN